MWTETFPTSQECGRHLPFFPSLPYFPEPATEALSNVVSLVLAGAREPIAREGADVTIVVCANRRYRILQVELARTGVAEPGPKAQSLTDLTRPVIDWVELAKGFGVPACSVRTDSEFETAFTRVLAEPGPSLIEAILA